MDTPLRGISQPVPSTYYPVVQDWVTQLTMQQQSVLFMALRGPDGVEKFHPSKYLVWAYRAFVLKAAWQGRELKPRENTGNTYMSRAIFDSEPTFRDMVKRFMDHIDSTNVHWTMHFMHAIEILGYKHPDETVAERWRWLYLHMCSEFHVTPESADEMDERLNDWGREHWSE